MNKIVRGEDVTLSVRLVRSTTGEPFSLAGITGASATFKGADAIPVTVAYPENIVVVSEALGALDVMLPRAVTSVLLVGEERPWQLAFDAGPSGSTRSIVTFAAALNVEASLF